MERAGTYRKVGVLELLAMTAVLGGAMNPLFRAETTVRRQLYSIMPQTVSVWLRRAGSEAHYATYTGLGDPMAVLPDDLDLIFIATPTQHAALAYAMARLYRAGGTSVALAGPHARAFPEDSARFADFVVTDCDEVVVTELISGRIPPGTILKSARALRDLPLVEERDTEIQTAAFVGGRQLRTTAISLLASLGCPYQCDFCSEWKTAHVSFDTGRVRRELETISRRYPGAIVAFHDPNFGVRFDDTLRAFEEADVRTLNPFVMETTLSLLNAARLKRLRDAGCLMVAPGIESWEDYSNKSRTTRTVGEAKYTAISNKLREVASYIPTIQANLILGIDADRGDSPFALTHRFIAEHPGVWTNINMPIPFGDSPFVQKVRREGRLNRFLPFAFYTLPYPALRPRHYELADYLRRMAEIYRAQIGARLLVERLAHMPGGLARWVVLARTIGLRAEYRELCRVRRDMEENTALRAFLKGRSRDLPTFFRIRLKQRMGRFARVLTDRDYQPRLPGYAHGRAPLLV